MSNTETNVKNQRSSMPRYQHIAIELATRIVSREFQEGQKIFARSTLASQYKVSAETARRAICVLTDLNIVSSEKGSGVTIESYENAEKFIQQQESRQSLDVIKNNILCCIEQQRKDMDNLDLHLTELVSATEHFRSLNPFVPFQILITTDCLYVNQNVTDIKFWQNTGATVVAVLRENQTLISPGPYVQLLENDIIFIVTQDSNPDVVTHFLYNKKHNFK